MSRRNIYLLIFIIIIAFTLYEELSLRKYLYKNHISPSFLADSLPNFLSVLIFTFGFMAIKCPTQKGEALKFIISIVAGLILYEFVQIWMPHMVFDIKDIIASIIGGLFSFGLIFMVDGQFK